MYMQMNQNVHVNKTNGHIKGFALGLVLKPRQKATRKSPINRLTPSGLTVIKGKLLLSSSEQLWVVQYGEISR